MFEIGWSELLILGVIALIVVGPKELPGLLRTIGRYAGILKKQASEFRGHFDQALKEAELDQLKNDLTGFRSEVEGAARDAMRTAEKQAENAKRAVNETKAAPSVSSTPGTAISEADARGDLDNTDENGLPIQTSKPPTAAAPQGAQAPADSALKTATGVEKTATAAEKTGAAEP